MPTLAARCRWACPAALLALMLGGCAASAVSVSKFNGEERAIAQKVADLEADTSARDQKRVCTNDLASALVARLDRAPGGCERAIKDQQAEIDPGLEVTVKSVHLAGTATARTATADVKSTFGGKSRVSTLALVKEGGRWRIAGIQ